ncbi:MAG: type II toxin-antitoxin system RelE/ParE family toxin [Bryobacteraceae bacterium]
MPHAEMFFFRDPEDDSVPLLAWLDGLPAKVRAKCVSRLDRLAELGHELRRPEADYLTDGIYELRASYQGVHYRMLYFFGGQAVVVLSHGLTKLQEVPIREIKTAIDRKKKVEANFEKFTSRSK